jgi:uncharacterized phiE125 gp8 family phage protein
MGLVRTVDPAISVVEFEDAVKQVELPSDDTTHTRHLERAIKAAIADAERHTRRAFITQTWRLSLREFPSRIYLPRPPLQSVTSITYVDSNGATQTLSSSLYQVSTDSSPGYIEPAFSKSWPSIRSETVDPIKITYVAGFGSDSENIPDQYKNLIYELVAFRFMNRGDTDQDIPKHIKWSLQSLRCGAMYDYFGVKN